MVTKMVELLISLSILAGLMAYYRIVPTIQALWVLCDYFLYHDCSGNNYVFGAAINVYYRDIGKALPIVLSLLMYASPVMYPLSLVHKKLILNKLQEYGSK